MAAKKGKTGKGGGAGKGSGRSRSPKKKSRRRGGSAASTHRSEIAGIIVLTVALMIAAAILSFRLGDPPDGSGDRVHNLFGIAGATVASRIIQFTFGRYISLVLPLLLAFVGLDLIQGRTRLPLLRRTILPLLIAATIAATGWGVVRAFLGLERLWAANGIIGWSLTRILVGYLGLYGAATTVGVAIVIYFTLLLRIRWREVFAAVRRAFAAVVNLLRRLVPALPRIEIPEPEEKERPVIRVPRPRLPRFGRAGGGEEEPEDAEPAPRKREKAQPEPEAAPEAQPEAGGGDGGGEAEAPPARERRRKPPVVKKPRLQPEGEGEEPGEAPSPSAGPPERDDPIDTSVPDPDEELPEPDPSRYELPPIELLEEHEEEEEFYEPDEEELQQRAEMLEDRLAEFGVEAEVVAIHPGPVITRYDLKPAAGVKVSKITNLAEDLALSLATTSIRMVPLPGAVGIEVPNPDQAPVSLREVVASEDFRESASPLAIALGKTAQGETMVVDLAKMPHLLIAGTTGSGKSVCINTIISSLLMRNQPHEVMIALIDPKKIELSAYAELRRHHLLFIEDGEEVIATEAKHSVELLQSLVAEMEARYNRFAEAGARSITEYNRFVEKGKVQPDDDGSLPRQMPYIVLIIDEFADLMLTARGDVEEPIARLAQMARAVGIHLVVATQRPSVNVLTGVIKANFPARIAFNVATKIDSRTILDRPGAESLLGRGDGLYLAGTSPQAVRFHGAFISTEEVQQLIAHVHNQPMFLKAVKLKSPDAGGAGGVPGAEDEERDELFEEGVRLVVRHQQGSVSLLQRRLKIGYSRAGRLLDQLEQAGVVGPFEGSKAREVLLTEEELDDFLDSMEE